MSVWTVAKVLVLSLSLGLVCVRPALGDEVKWSSSDPKCPRSSDGFTRESGTIHGSGGVHHWCFWYEPSTKTYNVSTRLEGTRGGVKLSVPDRGKGYNYYRNYLLGCANQEASGLGMCGWTQVPLIDVYT